VLEAPAVDPKDNGSLAQQSQPQNVVLRVTDSQAVELAFASDNGKVWVALRPQAGATQKGISLTNLERLIFGMDPIPIDRVRAQGKALTGAQ
jgi:Flp pilus assembly protein CpaB